MSDWEWPEEVLETSRREAREWSERREREAERRKLSSRLSRAWNNGHKFFSLLFQSRQGDNSPLIPFSCGDNGYSKRVQYSKNFAELHGLLAFFEIDNKPSSRTCHSCQIFLTQFLGFSCLPHDFAQVFRVPYTCIHFENLLVTARYHYMDSSGKT